MKRIASRKSRLSAPPSIIIGLGVDAAISLCLLAIASRLILNDQLAFQATTVIIPVVQFLGIFTGGIVAWAMCESRAGVVPMTVCACHVLLLAFSHVIFINESIHLPVGVIISAIAALSLNVFIALRGGAAGVRKRNSR